MRISQELFASIILRCMCLFNHFMTLGQISNERQVRNIADIILHNLFDSFSADEDLAYNLHRVFEKNQTELQTALTVL